MNAQFSHYLAGASAALTKLGVSNAWVQQKLLNAYRNGVTPERALRFEDKMWDITNRMIDAGAYLPSPEIPKDRWTIPKTEPRPLRPDLAVAFYDRHYEAMADKASGATNFLNRTLPYRYPTPGDAPKTLAEIGTSGLLPKEVEPYRHLRGDVYNLRESLGDIPEEVIDAQYALGGQHPRNKYVDKLNSLDQQREKPFTRRNQRIRQDELVAAARREAYEPRRVAEQADKQTAEETMPRQRQEQKQPAASGDTLKRRLLLGGAALAVPAAGYAAYRHFNKDEQSQLV
jgi:hypothetical protein